MSEEKRCGTCLYFTLFKGERLYGECAWGAGELFPSSLHRAEQMATTWGERCPVWEKGKRRDEC